MIRFQMKINYGTKKPKKYNFGSNQILFLAVLNPFLRDTLLQQAYSFRCFLVLNPCSKFLIVFCLPCMSSFFLLEEIHIQLFRNQMLAVMVLSQHRVSTSKTVSPRIPVGARCTGHVKIMCSAVCSAAPHSQFDVGARPHLCMND